MQCQLGKQPAFCVILNNVPGLSLQVKCAIRSFLQENKRLGKHNNPRPFSSPEVANKGIVSFDFFAKTVTN